MANEHNPVVCPTITVETNDPHHYRSQIDAVSKFATRIHIDLMDGVFAPTRSINLVQVWWPDGMEADLHLMLQKPSEHLETLVSLRPSLVIFHVESDGDIAACMKHLKRFGIKAGVGFLQHSEPARFVEMIEEADHVMLFGGSLGHFGGSADLKILEKIESILKINPHVEIGWDGGINADNIGQMRDAGVSVFDVGGYIQRSDSPKKSFQTLQSIIGV